MRLWVADGAEHIELCEQAGFEPDARADGALSWQRRLDLHDQWQADAFVQRHFRFGGQLHDLRAMLARQSLLVHRLSDDQVLHQVANELRFGNLRADLYHYRPQPVLRVNADSGAAVVAPVERPAPATPATAPKAVAATPPPVVETAPAQPSQEQVAAQTTLASMLEQAAKEAAPFCEVCELARAQQASAPVAAMAPQVEAAQHTRAVMLEQAAEQGVPFCEVCELVRTQAAVEPDNPPSPSIEAAQDAQATVLEQASLYGAPFCEICERNA